MTKKTKGMIALAAICILALIAATIIIFIAKKRENNHVYSVYIGAYGDKAVKYSFNCRTLEMSKLADYEEANPSFITLTPDGKFLYAVSENAAKSGISAFSNSFTPAKINRRRDIGIDPCYITFYKNYVLTANYGGGSISLFPTDTDGRIRQCSQIIKFIGSGPNKARQATSHIHTVRIIKGKDTGNDYVMATDLGCDKLYFFRFGNDSLKKESLKLLWCDTASYSVPKGYGPRHVEFSKDGQYMYLLCELSGRILVFNINEKGNNLILNQIQDTLSDRMHAAASADIHIHPNGKFPICILQKSKRRHLNFPNSFRWNSLKNRIPDDRLRTQKFCNNS
jgi:6-phosphogluconolactonase